MTTNGSDMDAAIIRGMTQPRITRRDLFKTAGAVAGAAGLSSGLSSVAGALPNSNVGSKTWWASQHAHHQLNFANWPYYIDTLNGTHPSLVEFKKEKGTNVSYSEVIEDNPAFYQRIIPSLSAGGSTGYDIIVMTNNSPQLGYLIQGGYLIPLDQDAMTNFKKYASPTVKNPVWDRGNKYTMAYQSGWTSLAYDANKVKTPGNSLQLMFSTKYKGQVGMFADPIELGAIGLMALGINPASSKPSDWTKAATKLRQQRDSGIVAAYYGNDYINHLKSGDLAISQCYSGDVFQANVNGSKNIKLLTPKEGLLFWTDNMAIPLYAANPRDAMDAMDFYFSPLTQAVVEYYVDYICPVPTAKNELLKPTGWDKSVLTAMKAEIGLTSTQVASATTIFPTAQQNAISKPYYQFKSQTEIDTWNETFLPIIQGQ